VITEEWAKVRNLMLNGFTGAQNKNSGPYAKFCIFDLASSATTTALKPLTTTSPGEPAL
jgi:hypothetical protein